MAATKPTRLSVPTQGPHGHSNPLYCGYYKRGRLFAELIRQGLLIEGNRAHEALHAEAKRLFEEVTKEVRT